MNIFCLLGFACTLTGYASAIDGDTIKIGDQRIRLQGVDAPEMSEPYGPAAREVMGNIVAQGMTTCRSTGEWSYNRIIATCTVHDLDVAIPLIAGGWALDCPAYSGGRYRQFELAGIRGQHISQKRYCKEPA
jgi:micrococcal nuclease